MLTAKGLLLSTPQSRQLSNPEFDLLSQALSEVTG